MSKFADLQDAIVALVQREHAKAAYSQVGASLTTRFYHDFKKLMVDSLMQLRSCRYVENFDVTVTPYPGDANDVLTTVVLRIVGDTKLHTANLRLSHGIWLYKVWNTPLPDLHATERLNVHAREIVNAAIASTQPQWSSGPAVDLNDPDSLKAHGITDLTQ